MIPLRFYEGVEAVVYIALNSGANPVSSKEICESQGRLPRHLEPVMQLLVRGGILKGTKGPKGGYTLAKEKRKITLSKLFKLFMNFESSVKSNSAIKNKIIIPLNKEIEDNIIKSLDKVTLEDLCGRASGAISGSESRNFII